MCRYMPYLLETIQTPSGKAIWVNAVTNPSMLRYYSEHVLAVQENGTMDIAVCSRASVENLSPHPDILLLIRLRREVANQ